eukprot:scaffold16092_cov127-Isochrysis_galbana.AAC.5
MNSTSLAACLSVARSTTAPLPASISAANQCGITLPGITGSAAIPHSVTVEACPEEVLAAMSLSARASSTAAALLLRCPSGSTASPAHSALVETSATSPRSAFIISAFSSAGIDISSLTCDSLAAAIILAAADPSTGRSHVTVSVSVCQKYVRPSSVGTASHPTASGSSGGAGGATDSLASLSTSERWARLSARLSAPPSAPPAPASMVLASNTAAAAGALGWPPRIAANSASLDWRALAAHAASCSVTLLRTASSSKDIQSSQRQTALRLPVCLQRVASYHVLELP